MLSAVGQQTVLNKIHELEERLNGHYLTQRMDKEKADLSYIKRAAKYFYKNGKKYSKSRNYIGPFIKPDGVVHSAPELAEMLSTQFTSIVNPRQTSSSPRQISLLLICHSLTGNLFENCKEALSIPLHLCCMVWLARLGCCSLFIEKWWSYFCPY